MRMTLIIDKKKWTKIDAQILNLKVLKEKSDENKNGNGFLCAYPEAWDYQL